MTTVGAPVRPSDGRPARAERTRDAVVEAYLELLEEGDAHPTARRIAERAGVSLRSVYVRFDDLDAVAAIAAQRQWERVRDITTRLPDDGPLDARLDAFIEQRCRVLELLAPVRRVAESQERANTGLATVLTWGRRVARREVARVFAPELRGLPSHEQGLTLDALDVAASTTTWEALRHHRGLSVAATRRVVTTMLAALLAHATEPERDR